MEMALAISNLQTDDFQDDTLEIAMLHAHLAARPGHAGLSTVRDLKLWALKFDFLHIKNH